MENQINTLNELAPLYEEFFYLQEPGQKLPKESEKIRKTPTFLGGYKRKFLMIYNAVPAINDKDKDKEMIHNLVVNGMKLSWDDIAFMNLREQEEMNLDDLISSLDPEKVICWGCEEEVSTSAYMADKYVVRRVGTIDVLLTDAISFYHDNQDMKKKLWASIQQLTSI